MIRRTLLVDALLALLVGLVAMAMLAGTSEQSAGGFRHVDAMGIGLVAASAAPLIFRRVAPVPVFIVVAAATLALAGFGYPFNFPFGPLVAVYALATRRTRGRLILAVGGSAVLLTGAALLMVRQQPVSEVAGRMVIWGLSLAGAWIAGELVRDRRERAAEARRRATFEAEQARKLAVAQERIRIARELHDSAGHALGVISVQAGAARLLYERDPEGSRTAITTIEKVAHDTMEEISRLVRAFRSDGETEQVVPSGPGALQELVARHRDAGLTTGLEVNGLTQAMSRDVARTAYRVLQEALTNAGRHGTGQAHVTIDFLPDAVELTVTNPVAGGTPAGGGGSGIGGYGLIGMRERIALANGTLETVNAGTTFRIHARLPHPKEA
ncbi:histidine kinase [Nonomuraea phyllanthi]|uniref:sensor histidine kinase n=1 Tax=Nonomuraea phyllanthi TaxID=2219224 RepID=UPI001293B6C3|nr:histidine kinase [Nonomuraea phyllanthi]QFY09952.1 histidine kinase [Nonomuraea phyllanthi]